MSTTVAQAMGRSGTDNVAKIPSGYKWTEVGVIPKDWEVRRLGHLGKPRGGSGFPLRYQGSASGDYPFFKVSDMNNEGNSVFMVNANHWISEDIRRTLGAQVFPSGTIVFAKIGAAIFLERKRLLAQDSCIDNNMMGFVLSNEDADRRFLHLAFLRIELGKLVSMTALPSLAGKQIEELAIALPSASEQRAIVAVLSHMDSLIEALDKLIAKKRAIKKGAMQQLLTGKTRLPGFEKNAGHKVTDVGVIPRDWSPQNVRQLGQVLTGGTPRTEVKEYWGREYPWVTPTDIGNRRDMVETERFLTAEGLRTIRRLPQNAVLVTCIASIGKNAILRAEGGCNQQINAVIPHKENSPEFLYYLFDFSKQYLLANAGMTATNIISKSTFENLVFPVPPPPEQRAIAAVLSAMDAEIAALEQRRDKTKSIKQGMMQALFTGRVRLVKPGAKT